jgi:hypothetical protein
MPLAVEPFRAERAPVRSVVPEWAVASQSAALDQCRSMRALSPERSTSSGTP